MSLFKANYSYKLKILLLLQQVKKSSKTVKERVETFCYKVWYIVPKYTLRMGRYVDR